MKNKLPSCAILTAIFWMTASAAWAENAKVQVCHIPPGNPANFHTITISENALQAHLGHGDLAGACFAHCNTLCDDGNACTIDACNASEQCLNTHPPVNCDDSNLCTTDSCNPASGCASVPKTCTDGNNCTVDACDPLTGSCVAPPVSCPAGQSCNPSNGACEGTVPTDGCLEPAPGTTCPCVAASADFANLVGSPGTCSDSGTFINKTTGGAFVSALCEPLAGTGFCATSSGDFLDITLEEGTVCVRLIREACTP